MAVIFCCSIMMSVVANATKTTTNDKIEDAITEKVKKADSITTKINQTVNKKLKKEKATPSAKVTISANDTSFQMTAVSDTTGVELEDDTTAVSISNNFNPMDLMENFEENNWIEAIVAIIAIICAILVPIVAVFALPILIIWLILSSRRKRERERNELLKTIAASGKDTTPIAEMIEQEEKKKEMPDSKAATYNKGIRNVCLGVGLAIFFWFLTGSLGITAIGFLIICIGIGQILTSKYGK